MSLLELLIALAGASVTVIVVIGMILLAPPGSVPVHEERTDPEGSNLSPVPARRPSRYERAHKNRGGVLRAAERDHSNA